jgi:hypothetical protein
MILAALFQYQTLSGLAAAATAIALAFTLFLVVKKHSTILSEFHTQIGQKRERVLSTIERQLKEAIETFCSKHLLMVPQNTFSKSAHQRLEPFLPQVKELENTFAKIDSKLSQLLTEVQ